MSKEMNHPVQEHLILAYDKMVSRVTEALAHVKDDGLPPLKAELAAARKKAVELGELTHEEAVHVSEYLQRDLEAAARFLERNREQFSTWLKFDIALVEERLGEAFATLTDHTRSALDRIAADAEAAVWKTGEVTGPGTLYCENCDQHIHFHKTGHIPPCPKCHHARFRRPWPESSV